MGDVRRLAHAVVLLVSDLEGLARERVDGAQIASAERISTGRNPVVSASSTKRLCKLRTSSG